MLDFINKRNKTFNFKTFEIVLLATVNSIIVMAILLLNLYTIRLLKFYDQRRQLDILIKDVIISRNIAFERVKRQKREYANVIKLLVSHFFVEKLFFQPLLLLKQSFLKKSRKMQFALVPII